MPTFTHVISSTPGNPVSYNPSMAETFSWVPITDANRPFYARATYLTNASDISISTGNIAINNTEVENRIDITNSRLNDTNTRLNTLSTSVNSIDNKLNTLITRANQQLGLNGFDILQSGTNHVGSWTTLTVVSLSAKFNSLGALNSNTTGINHYELPMTFTMSGPLTSINLQYGAVVAYR
jgi:hypothetical protein